MNDDSLHSFRNDDALDFSEEMDAEGRIMDDEAKHDALVAEGFEEGTCKNCLDSTCTKNVKGVDLCRTCAERYPAGMPF